MVVEGNIKLFAVCVTGDDYFVSSSSIYRYVLEPEVTFRSDSSFSPGPMAKFLDMPQSPLFTLNLNTPESWMVESVHTRYDLDNIYLEEVHKQKYVSGFDDILLFLNFQQ